MAKAAYSCRFLPVAIAAVLFLPSVASGQRGGGGRGGTGKMTIPVQKSGKVVMEDGTPLPESVLVEAACAGTVLPVARTDSKGGFIIGRGREADVDARFQSGSTAGGITAGCWLRARLPGYESSVLRVTDSETFDLGTIVLKRPAGIEGTAYSATSLKAPKPAQKALEKAQAAMQKKKWDEARPQLEKALELYPEYAAAWWELGRVREASGDLAQARNAYERSIKADPKFVRPYLQLSGVFHKEKNWRGAADVTATVIKLDPFSYPGAHMLNAISNLRLGNMDAAEASARQAIKLDTGHTFPEAEYALGLILDTKGDSKGAAEHLRSFLQLAPNSPGAEAIKGRLAELDQASAAPPAPQPPAPK